MIIDSLYEEINALKTLWTSFFIRIRNNWDRFDQPMSCWHGISLQQLDSSCRLALELILDVRPVGEDSPGYPVLTARYYDIKTEVQNIAALVKQLSDTIEPHWDDSTRIVSLNDHFHWGFDNNGVRHIDLDLTSNFEQLSRPIANLMRTTGEVVPLCRTGSIADLAQRSGAYTQLLAHLQAVRVEAESLLKNCKTAAKSSSADVSKIETFVSKADENLSHLRELLTQANTERGQVTAQIEHVKQITINASTLEQTVGQYQAKFNSFNDLLSRRQDELYEFEVRSRELEQRNKDQESAVNDLITKSEKMVAGATTVGLAKFMEDARKRFEDRMKSNKCGFYFSVSLLFFSSLPLAFHLAPEFFQWLFVIADKPLPINSQVDGNPYELFGKFLLLVPATWLTVFFSKDYAQLFQLEREYAHKAALASSVHGFKLQAQKYEEEITAEVFMEIQKNPAYGPKVEPASHPLYDVLTKAVSQNISGISSKKD